MNSKVARRNAIQDFKSRKTPRGIFAVRSGGTGPLWLGSSPNLDAAQNGLWFRLNVGSHRKLALQEAWNREGVESFRFEVLEQLDDDLCALSVSDLLKEKRNFWLAELDAHPV